MIRFEEYSGSGTAKEYNRWKRSVRLLTDFNELTKSALALLTVGNARGSAGDAVDTLEIEHHMKPLGLEMVWKAHEDWDRSRRRHRLSVNASTIRPSEKSHLSDLRSSTDRQ